MAISAEELNIILQVRDQQFRKALAADERRIQNFARKGQQNLDRFARSYGNMGRSVGAQRAALQNASFQVQDIITQISMGTPAVRALSIQLPQLLGGFGAMGAAIGVAVGALGFLPQLLGDTTDEVDGLDQAMEELEKSTQGATDQLQMLEMGLASIGQLRAQQQINELLVERQRIEQELEEMSNRDARNARGRLAVIAEEVNLLEETIQKNQDALDALRNKETQIENNKKATEATTQATEDLAAATRGIDFSTAIEGARQLSAEIGVSLHQAMQMLKLVGAARQAFDDSQNIIFDPRDPRYNAEVAERASRAAAFKALQDSGALYTSTPITSSRGGGGSRSGGGRTTARDHKDQLDELTDALKEAREEQEAIAGTIEGALTDAWMSAIDGTKSFEDAIRDMARSVIMELTRVLVVQQAIGSFNSETGQGSGIVGALMGAISGRASGGSVRAGRPYMVGEHGPEPFIPAQNGRVLSVAQAKSAMGGTGTTVINQNNTFMSDVRHAVRTEIKSQQGQLIQASIAAVEAKQRRSVR